ncbi:MAG: four helix bundle protein [Sedimentisphaeraceae bacterium JB056]
MINSYRDLLVWQKGMLLVKLVYCESESFPDFEMFGLASQLRRAVVSIPSNIAEGYGRNSTQDYMRFLRMSIGSLYEVQTQLEIACELNYILRERLVQISDVTIELEKMLTVLVKKLAKGTNRHN